jgi:hypothetical protein
MPKTAALAKPAQLQHTPPGDAASSAASPTRHDLAELKMDLREAERAALAARAPIARLEAEIADEGAARALLAELDADYAARIAAWAASGSNPGAAPEPGADRREAEATLEAASLKAEAARNALAAVRQRVAEADATVGAIKARARPAVAAVLREEGAWLIAEYWRRYADLEQVRRELTALDQVLIAEFPVIHAPTGRMVVEWLSPVKLSAAAALDAAEAATAGLDDVAEYGRFWRARAAELEL